MTGRKYVISIIIILTILLEISFICINLNIYSKNNQKYSNTFSKRIFLTNKAAVLSTEKLKNCISTRIKQTYPNQNNSYCFEYQIRIYSSSDKLIDYREYIRQSIPHYFNGSNYKIITSSFYNIS